jgi:hypothetical protein
VAPTTMGEVSDTVTLSQTHTNIIINHYHHNSPRNAHCLAGLLIAVAILGAILHYIHWRSRKNLYLASQPGSVAHYMSILSEAQRVSLQEPQQGHIGPLDDDKTMLQKLRGTRFMLDPNGGLVAVPSGETAPRLPKRESNRFSKGSVYEMEDPRKSLLEFGAEPYKTEPYVPDPQDPSIDSAKHSPL